MRFFKKDFKAYLKKKIKEGKGDETAGYTCTAFACPIAMWISDKYAMDGSPTEVTSSTIEYCEPELGEDKSVKTPDWAKKFIQVIDKIGTDNAEEKGYPDDTQISFKQALEILG